MVDGTQRPLETCVYSLHRVGDEKKQAVASVLFGYTSGGAREKVWMSHGDEVVKLPAGFSVVATSDQVHTRMKRMQMLE